MTEFMPDCLVLKLEEVEETTGKVDSTIYIIYDKMLRKYLVRGRRRWSPIHQSCTYSFECSLSGDLTEFLQYIISEYNHVNETLYNYDNLPENANDITFEFLQENDHSDYEIAGYDEQELTYERVMRNLKMLRTISNQY